MAAGKLDALGDSKSHESGGSRRYGITSPPHAVSGGSTGSTSRGSSAIIRLGGFLNASIVITVAAAMAFCNEVALACCDLLPHHCRRWGHSSAAISGGQRVAQQLPRLAHLVEPDKHATLAPQHALHAALAQALLQLYGVALDHQRAVALHLHDGHGLQRTHIRRVRWRAMRRARSTGTHGTGTRCGIAADGWYCTSAGCGRKLCSGAGLCLVGCCRCARDPVPACGLAGAAGGRLSTCCASEAWSTGRSSWQSSPHGLHFDRPCRLMVEVFLSHSEVLPLQKILALGSVFV
ncbi:hypothetical protein HNP48_006845 [Acidovorax soli]|uniref:Uncharacterized protein n=1 Tax=Acidovorax soli TaxID=592050 RepID=A0A7X0UDI5_9BURK|nr:hypothetical protein [Acidovorax soli]